MNFFLVQTQTQAGVKSCYENRQKNALVESLTAIRKSEVAYPVRNPLFAPWVVL